MSTEVTMNGHGEKDSGRPYRRHGRVRVENPNLARQTSDVLYHLALNSTQHDFKRMFNDVKFVCVGGSARRMEYVANFIQSELGFPLPPGQALTNIARDTDRYALYKVGPVLCVSHGIGITSFSVMMHELIKLLYYAHATDVCCFRLGTSGGIGVNPGSVVITEQAVDGLFRPVLEKTILGKRIQRPAILDKSLINELLSMADENSNFETLTGNTMCVQDFYESQARLDGAFCEYDETDKMAFIERCHELGIRNIEMESLCFAAMTHAANIRGAVVCAVLLDRFHGDQLTTSTDVLDQWAQRPVQLVTKLIKKRLNLRTVTTPIETNGNGI